MSEFSLTLVLQFQTSKIIHDMTNISIKSQKITPFGGIFHVMEKFDHHIGPVVDGELVFRCTTFGYQYSEIARARKWGHLTPLWNFAVTNDEHIGSLSLSLSERACRSCLSCLFEQKVVTVKPLGEMQPLALIFVGKMCFLRLIPVCVRVFL